MTGNDELHMHKAALLLDYAQTIDETPDSSGVVHLKLRLDASICSFSTIHLCSGLVRADSTAPLQTERGGGFGLHAACDHSM